MAKGKSPTGKKKHNGRKGKRKPTSPSAPIKAGPLSGTNFVTRDNKGRLHLNSKRARERASRRFRPEDEEYDKLRKERYKLLAGTSQSTLPHPLPPGERLKRSEITGLIVRAKGGNYPGFSEIAEAARGSNVFSHRLERMGSTVSSISDVLWNPITYFKERKSIRPAGYTKTRLSLSRIQKDVINAIHAQTGIVPQVSASRIKTWKQRLERGKHGPVYDSLGIRLFAETEEECYKIADFLMSIPHPEGVSIPIVGDYNRRPRAGAYRAIHIVTDALSTKAPSGDAKKPLPKPFGLVEFQIKTKKMDAETTALDTILGQYKGEGKKSRIELKNHANQFYTDINRAKSEGGRARAFDKFLEQSKQPYRYYNLMLVVSERAGILTGDQRKELSNRLRQKRRSVDRNYRRALEKAKEAKRRRQKTNP